MRSWRSPSPLLCCGRKRLQLASVSSPCLGVALRKPSIRPPPAISATDAVPGSVLIGLHPGGYANVAPSAVRAIVQPAGGEDGGSQANGEDGRARLSPLPPAVAMTATASRARETTAAAMRVRRLVIAFDLR